MDLRGIGSAPRTLRLAHRGDHRVEPENSLAALLAATALPGCDGVEFDVRASRDGVPMLSHDPTLRRVHGRPEAVSSLRADELEAIGLARLDEVLARLPRRTFLDIELKEELGRPLIEVLAAGRGPELGAAVVSSFDPVAIARVRGLAPSWPCWLNVTVLTRSAIATAVELECAGISVEWRGLGPRRLAAARSAGLVVAAWTVTDRLVFAQLVEQGIAAVCIEGDALTL